MNFAPLRDWEHFGALKRAQLQKKMVAFTPEQRLDEYADIFDAVTELRSHTGIDYRTEQLREEKLAIRNRLIESYRKLEPFRLGYQIKKNDS